MIEFRPFNGVLGGFMGRDQAALRPLGLKTEDFAQVKQVHGDRRISWRGGDKSVLRRTEADALVTDCKGEPVAVRAADCVPILIAHPGGAVAAVHAGWKGSLAEILKKTLIQMKAEMGLDPSQAFLAIGPAICGRCYEVGGDVAKAFTRFPGSVKERPGGKFLLDLKLINRNQAEEAGVNPAKIEIRSECTLCEERYYYSYRGEIRQGKKGEGRNLAWVMLR